MDLEKLWSKALKHTEIIRSRVHALLTFQDTHVPYVFLSESTINEGDTVVRKGEVLVEKPSIILPPHIPQFEGFEFGEEKNWDEDSIINFLLVRGVTLPSLKYNNKTHSLNIYEGNLNNAINHYNDWLQHHEDVHTGLITGPEECWQFCVLIFICSQVAKNADIDIKNLLKGFKKRREGK